MKPNNCFINIGKGVLFGLAAGDLRGGPISMALLLAESLIERGRFDADDVLQRYVEGYRRGAVDQGPVTEIVLRRVHSGEHVGLAVQAVHEESGRSAGCGPVHRCAPLAMASFIDDDALPDIALTEAALTHYDPIAGEVSAAVVVLIRKLIKGFSWSDALECAAKGRPEVIRHALLSGKRPSDKSGYAPAVLAAAVYFLSHHDTFDGALNSAFKFAGHENYCPVLVGAIGGARWGVDKVPLGRIRHTELLSRIRSVMDCCEADGV